MTKKNFSTWTLEEIDIIKKYLEKYKNNQSKCAREIVSQNLIPNHTYASIQSKASKIYRGIDTTGTRKYRKRYKSRKKSVSLKNSSINTSTGKKIPQKTFTTPVSKKPIASLQDLGSVTFKDVKYLEFVSEKTIVIYLK